MKNLINKMLVGNDQIRLYMADQTELVRKVYQMNERVPAVPKLLLAQTLSLMGILTGTLKGNQRLSLALSMSDRTQKISADADARGNIRGYLNEALFNMQECQYGSTHDLIGPRGMLRMVKGNNLHQYTSITDMPAQNIAEDFARHFMQSDQTLTHFAAPVRLGPDGEPISAHAIYAQLLPGASPELLDELKRILGAERELLAEIIAGNLTGSEEALQKVFKGMKLIGTSECRFFCGCTRELFIGLLRSLGKEEISKTIKDNRTIETFCHVCGKRYSFMAEEVVSLM